MSGFRFKGNGDITYTNRDGETYTLFHPRLGDMEQIELHEREQSEALKADPRYTDLIAPLEATREAIKEARSEQGEEEKLDSETVKEIIAANSLDDDEGNRLMEAFIALQREQSMAWFVKVVDVVGSANWPRTEDGEVDTSQLPMSIQRQQLVDAIKRHWRDNPVPLAESPNGATQATRIEAVN